MKRRIISILAAIVMVVSLLPIAARAAAPDYAAGGSGTATDPYIIMTSEQLAALADEVTGGVSMNNMYFKLGADIGSTTTPFTKMIGVSNDVQFKGNFDGDGHTVTVAIESSENDVGLFGNVYGATISNLTVDGSVSTTRAWGHCGGIAGVGTNCCISYCCNKATVSASCQAYVGGIVGYLNGSNCKVINCCNEGNISITGAMGQIGGIAGCLRYENSLVNSYNLGNVSGGGDCGGIVGNLQAWSSAIVVANCYNAGTVSAGKGGIIGKFYDANCSAVNCYFDSTINSEMNVVADNTVGCTVTDCTGLSTTQMKAEAGAEDALIDKLNTGRAGHADWFEWIPDEISGYPTLLPPLPPQIHIIEESEVEFMAWTDTLARTQSSEMTADGNLPNTEGNYYLTKDVELTAAWELPSGITNLCLNGHVIKLFSKITVGAGQTLNIYDCNTTAQRKFTVDTDGLWVLDDTLSGEAVKHTVTGGAIIGVSVGANGACVAVSEGGTFTLNGGAITGSKATGYKGGAVYMENGTFIMNDGYIVGNTALRGGGVYVSGATSQFTLNGGYIIGNTASDGSGAYFAKGTSTMNGGMISSNTANGSGCGVKVSNLNRFYMYGGEISGNIAGADGCGVRAEGGYFAIGGAAKIIENMAGDKEVNVYLANFESSATKLDIVADENNQSNAYFGVTTENKPSVATPVAITYQRDSNKGLDFSSCVKSDDATYAVRNDDGVVKLMLAGTVTNATTVADAGTNNGYINIDKEKACRNDNVTVTVFPNEDYELDSLVYNDTENHDISGTNSFTMPGANVTVTATFKRMTVATPVANPVAGTYSTAQTVTLSTTTEGADIYYTTDGTEPTTGSTKYTSAITVDSNKTIKAIAVKGNQIDSSVLTAEYTIKKVMPYNPDPYIPEPATTPELTKTPEPTQAPADTTESAQAADEYTIPVESDKATVQVSAKIDEGTAAVNEITEDILNNIVSKKAAGSEAEGTEGETEGTAAETEGMTADENNSIIIDLSGAKQSINSVELSKKSVENLSEAVSDENNNIDFVIIKLTNTSIVIDKRAIDTVYDSMEGNTLILVVDKTAQKDLNDKQTETLADYNVNRTFEAYFESNGKEIHDFQGGNVTVGINFKPEKSKKAENYKVYYIAKDGTLEECTTKYEDGRLYFITGHLSDYVVIYDNVKDVLLTEAVTTKKGYIKLSWNKVDGAVKYVVYGAKCGKSYKKLAELDAATDGSAFTAKKVSGAKPVAGKTYKFYVVAYDALGNKVKSRGIHYLVGNTSAKYANVETITAKQAAVELTVGEKFTVGADYTMFEDKKHLSKKHGTAIRFTSNCPEVAKVASNGTVTAKKAGTATIYIQDITGKWCTVEVTVKK